MGGDSLNVKHQIRTPVTWLWKTGEKLKREELRNVAKTLRQSYLDRVRVIHGGLGTNFVRGALAELLNEQF
jgi:hypothetical protein